MTLPEQSSSTETKADVHLFRTPAEARALATELSRLAPNPAAVETGLFELFINAIEHGNLAIGHIEKRRLLEEDRLLEAIEARLAAPPYGARQVRVEVIQTDKELRFTIRDEGTGFDWKAFEGGPQGTLDEQHGRGIMIARRLAFSRLDFSGTGSCVTAAVFL
ncbi:ATP-binding protein [Kordiimonas marina]|uniref:ATP-binding protein n=1 Tax=Kordiimonas marina TaxID=2872312 RepID=UPI001FF39F68|nr:ATP-binding protein [Kordiimonas marina]MCJ9427952.1 ATP-binding protein [Kordiimonas marina]